MFDLKNYNQLYEIPDHNVQEIKISPGIMLLIFEHAPTHVPLKILSMCVSCGGFISFQIVQIYRELGHR